ncbi:hypothetical protein M0R45_015209 [Rubus argutus]|uniref:Uncharacterized protein n=1 Tax=Rubus argutus TaxID=59490 RepID=A0AAW1XNM4_RUBAR
MLSPSPQPPPPSPVPLHLGMTTTTPTASTHSTEHHHRYPGRVATPVLPSSPTPAPSPLRRDHLDAAHSPHLQQLCHMPTPASLSLLCREERKKQNQKNHEFWRETRRMRKR